MDILKMITALSNDRSTLNQLNESVGAKSSQVEKLVQLGIPMLMEAMNRNTNTPQGAQSLFKALDKHQNDQVDNIPTFLQNADTEDGMKILQHIFASKNQSIKNNLSKNTGLNQEQVSSVLSKLAPLLLGLLGNEKKAKQLDANGVSDLTSNLSKNLQQFSGENLFSMATKLLDANQDGSILDDIVNLFGKFRKK